MPEAQIEIETEDGALDAFVACPETPGRKQAILVFAARDRPASGVEFVSRWLAAHNYFALAPRLSGLSADDRREAVIACLDHLGDERRVDDERVGILGFGAGADLGLWLAANRAERIAAVAAYGLRGFSPRSSFEIANKINGLVRIGYAVGDPPMRAGALEAAFNLAGVLFDIEVCGAAPDWSDLLDFFSRGLGDARATGSRETHAGPEALNP